ncbi:hypothetical protein [Elizabethkingia ursingii]
MVFNSCRPSISLETRDEKASTYLTTGKEGSRLFLHSSEKNIHLKSNAHYTNDGKCGAYLGPNKTLWKEFMCHDLGADTSANPFKPSAAIHGAKYQWGALTGEKGRYVSQKKDQDPKSFNALPGWILYDANKPNGNGKPDGSWNRGTEDNPKKTDQDPCPSGFRVPTRKEWKMLLTNNPQKALGEWGYLDENLNSYAAAVQFGDNLVLPGAGIRFASRNWDDVLIKGKSIYRGSQGMYYTSTDNQYEHASGAWVFIFNSSNGTTELSSHRVDGYSVRCIEE